MSDSKLFARSKVEELRAELQAGASGKDKSFAKRKVVLKRSFDGGIAIDGRRHRRFDDHGHGRVESDA